MNLYRNCSKITDVYKNSHYLKCKINGRFKADYSTYKNSMVGLRLTCLVCNKSFDKPPTAILCKEFECPWCNDIFISYDTILKRNKKIYGDLFTIPEFEYIDENQKFEFICNICGNSNYTNGHMLVTGQTACKYCNGYAGERAIATFLNSYSLKENVDYFRNKTFDGLKDKKLLSYDFYLPKYNLLIEYNGEQHYMVKTYFHEKNISLEEAEENFKIQQKHDQMKFDFAKNNNINLLIISYKQKKNISNILKEALNENN